MAKISIFNGRISTVRNYDVTCDLWWNTDCFDNRLIIWIQLPSCEYFLISIDIIWSKQMISLVSDWENNLQMSISPRLQFVLKKNWTVDVRKTSSREIKMFLNMRGLPLDMSSISFTSSNIAASITGSHTNTNIFWKVCWWLIQTSKILSKNHFLSAGMTFISYSDIGLFRSLWFPSLISLCFVLTRELLFFQGSRWKSNQKHNRVSPSPTAAAHNVECNRTQTGWGLRGLP